jgi:MoaA/NifB/PqqE/SkfB family radical SAM enzyme
MKERSANLDDFTKKFEKNFDYIRLFEVLENRNVLSKNTLVSLSSGEITISPRINQLLDACEKYNICFNTNGIIYNQRIATLASRRGSYINISIDSGTPHTYNKVKGKNAFDIVLVNISQYIKEGANLKVKFIFFTENTSELEIYGFVLSMYLAGVKEINLAANYGSGHREYTNDELLLIAKCGNLAKQFGILCSLTGSFSSDEKYAIQQYAQNC